MLSYGHSQELGRLRKPSGRERLAHAQRDVGGARRGGRWALGSGVRGTQWAEPALLQGRERNYSHSSASHPSVGHKLAETAVAHLCLATLDGARERRARRSEGRHRARRGVGARREEAARVPASRRTAPEMPTLPIERPLAARRTDSLAPIQPNARPEVKARS